MPIATLSTQAKLQAKFPGNYELKTRQTKITVETTVEKPVEEEEMVLRFISLSLAKYVSGWMFFGNSLEILITLGGSTTLEHPP